MPKRKGGLAIIAKLFLLVSLFFPKPVNSQGSAPNIIVFLVDDMGWQDCSVPFLEKKTSQNLKFLTPNLEKLARMGIKFTNAYANPVCTPSRISLITGMNVARHGVTNWTNVHKDDPTDYPDSLLSPPDWNFNGLSPVSGIDHTIIATPLPLLLRNAGYYSIHCGKAHFAPYGTPGESPLNLGFDVNIGGSAAGNPGSYLASENYRYNENDTLWHIRGLEEYARQGLFLTEALTREAIKKLKGNRPSNRPFFLYMAHYAVHLPYSKDDRFYTAYKERGLSDIEARYAALVEGMDKSLGDLLDFLKTEGILEDTYIIFLSDNGGLSLAPPRSGPVHTQNLPLKQGKGSLYEGGIRVPMIVAGPGIKEGDVNDQYVCIEDLFPTILDWAGIGQYSTLQRVDGRSLVPFLADPALIDSTRLLLWHYPNKWIKQVYHGTGWTTALRKGKWKLIYFHQSQTLELYDLSSDIGEERNLALLYPQKMKEMAVLMTDELKRRGALMPLKKKEGRPIPWPDEIQ